jgi:hypothetical protein
VLPGHKDKPNLLTEPTNNYSILNFCSKGGGRWVNFGKNTIFVSFVTTEGNKPSISGLLVTCSTIVLPGHKEKPSLLTEPADNYSILKFCSKGGGCWVNLG